MQRSLYCFLFTVSLLSVHSLSFAFDSAKDSTVDKADHFDFENFHKDSAVTLWGKDKKDDSKAVTTYEEPTTKEQTTKEPVIKEGTLETQAVTSQTNLAPAETVTKPQTPQKYDKGQILKVRSAYKLSADPSLAGVPTLFEAIQDLHKQLNSYCAKGWTKEEEWHKPEANYFYIHYRATCL